MNTRQDTTIDESAHTHSHAPDVATDTTGLSVGMNDSGYVVQDRQDAAYRWEVA